MGVSASTLLSARKSVLLAVDLQERLLPAIPDHIALLQRVVALLDLARRLSVPRLFTEHCGDRIGAVAPWLQQAAGTAECIDKVHFAVTAEAGVTERLRALERPQAVVVGTEAHVCVLQSAIGLLAAGFEVYLVSDAIGSRQAGDRCMAIERARALGIRIVTTEMVLFEWLERGDSEAFRQTLPAIRDLTRPPGSIEELMRLAAVLAER